LCGGDCTIFPEPEFAGSDVVREHGDHGIGLKGSIGGRGRNVNSQRPESVCLLGSSVVDTESKAFLSRLCGHFGYPSGRGRERDGFWIVHSYSSRKENWSYNFIGKIWPPPMEAAPLRNEFALVYGFK
jgi:hypothetical protein